METISHNRAMSTAVALFMLAASHADNANAQAAPPPTKEIVIYNNSSETIYPVLQAPQQSNPANPDNGCRVILWSPIFLHKHLTLQRFTKHFLIATMELNLEGP